MRDDKRDEQPDGNAERRQAQLLALVKRKHGEQQDDDGRCYAEQHEFQVASRHVLRPLARRG